MEISNLKIGKFYIVRRFYHEFLCGILAIWKNKIICYNFDHEYPNECKDYRCLFKEVCDFYSSMCCFEISDSELHPFLCLHFVPIPKLKALLKISPEKLKEFEQARLRIKEIIDNYESSSK